MTSSTPQSGRAFAARFFVVAVFLEALSWIALLIAMYVKWVAEGGERGVEIAGPIHGTLFIVYLVSVLIAAERLGWSMKEVVIGLLAGIPPLCTVIFERWMALRGRLSG